MPGESCDQFPSVFELSTLDGENGFTINGAHRVGDGGDLNGDGLNEIFISDPSTGKVYGIFGNPSLTSTINVANLSTSVGFEIYGETGLGSAMTFVEDLGLVIGSPTFSNTYVVYMNSAADAWNNGPYDINSLMNGIDGVQLPGPSGTEFGFSLTSGFLNSDDKADLLIGAPAGNGAVYVVYNDAWGNSSSFDVSNLDGNFGYKITNDIQSNARFGHAITIGDFNGDGLKDIGVGAPHAGVDADGGHPGSAYGIYNNNFGNNGMVSLSAVTATSGGGFILNGATFRCRWETSNFGFVTKYNKYYSEELGKSLTSINLDSTLDNLAIGAPGYSIARSAVDCDNDGSAHTVDEIGRSYLIYGSFAIPVLINSDDFQISGVGSIINNDYAGNSEHSGAALYDLGDLSNSGLPALLVNANEASPNSINQAGTSHLLFLTPDAIPNIIDLPQTIPQGMRINGFTANDQTGLYAAGLGPIKNSFTNAFALGAPGSNSVFVINGKSRAQLNFPQATRVIEGAQVIINGTNLQSKQWALGDNGIIFNFPNQPPHGSLFFNGILISDSDTILEQDVHDTNLLTYFHDGSETLEDEIVVCASKCPQVTCETTGTLYVSIIPENDPPFIVHNNPYAISEGAFGLIGNAWLQVSDPDNSNSQLMYRILNNTRYGTLKFNSLNLVVGSTYSQQAVDLGSFGYENDGSDQILDSFVFEVEDGAGGKTEATTFIINISPVADIPVIVRAGLSISRCSDQLLTTQDLLVSDVDNSDDEIIISVQENEHLRLYDVTDQSNSTSFFSFAQSSVGHTIRVKDDCSDPELPRTLAITASDGVTISEISYFVINFNDIPQITFLNPVILDENRFTVIDNSVFIATDEETPDYSLEVLLDSTQGWPAYRNTFNTPALSAPQFVFSGGDFGFTSNNNSAPVIKIAVTDGRFTTAFQTLPTLFNLEPKINIPSNITVNPRQRTPLSFYAYDNPADTTTPNEALRFVWEDLFGASIEFTNSQIRITSYTQQEQDARGIVINTGEITPSGKLSVCDERICTAPQPIHFISNQEPILVLPEELLALNEGRKTQSNLDDFDCKDPDGDSTKTSIKFSAKNIKIEQSNVNIKDIPISRESILARGLDFIPDGSGLIPEIILTCIDELGAESKPDTVPSYLNFAPNIRPGGFIDNFQVISGEPFEHEIDLSIFDDPNPSDILNFTLQVNEYLEGLEQYGLAFNNVTGKLEGSLTQPTKLWLTATDPSGLNVSTSFKVMPEETQTFLESIFFDILVGMGSCAFTVLVAMYFFRKAKQNRELSEFPEYLRVALNLEYISFYDSADGDTYRNNVNRLIAYCNTIDVDFNFEKLEEQEKKDFAYCVADAIKNVDGLYKDSTCTYGLYIWATFHSEGFPSRLNPKVFIASLTEIGDSAVRAWQGKIASERVTHWSYQERTLSKQRQSCFTTDCATSTVKSLFSGCVSLFNCKSHKGNQTVTTSSRYDLTKVGEADHFSESKDTGAAISMSRNPLNSRLEEEGQTDLGLEPEGDFENDEVEMVESGALRMS